jgi:hypothetical protein
MFLASACPISVLAQPRRRAVTFGDPHYIKLDGTMVTCNQIGWQLYAAADFWSVEVEHVPAGGLGARINRVRVRSLSPLNPADITLGPTQWASQVLFSGQPDEIVIRPDSLTIAALDLLLTLQLDGNRINVGLSSGNVKEGIAIDGCPGSNPANVSDPRCASLVEPYRTACSFDVTQTGDDSYVQSSNSAAAMYEALPEGEERKASSGLSTGAVVGLVIACLIVVALVVIGVIFFRRRAAARGAGPSTSISMASSAKV